MKTAFSSGPGLFAVATDKTDKTIPHDQIRLFIARVEAYDGPKAKGTEFDKLEFLLLPAMATGNPQIARALVELHSSLTANLELLKTEAGK